MKKKTAHVEILLTWVINPKLFGPHYEVKVLGPPFTVIQRQRRFVTRPSVLLDLAPSPEISLLAELIKTCLDELELNNEEISFSFSMEVSKKEKRDFIRFFKEKREINV